ncbi:hypothetical protein [Methylobacterium sp. yr596]|nr:hypothetical protein [Methylobacterium sp. yr596]
MRKPRYRILLSDGRCQVCTHDGWVTILRVMPPVFCISLAV